MTILILGAGILQKSAILAAKELGAQCAVVDANPNAPCVNLADIFSPIDLKDKEKILDFAKSLQNLKAVFTAGTDFSSSVAFVAENLGLPGHSYEAALNASDKIKMRNAFKKNGAPSPDFFEINEKNFHSILQKIHKKKISLPKVVKPSDNMGSRACRLAKTKEDFILAAEDALKNSKTQRAIAEDFIRGKEFSVDALVFDGTLTITGFADRHIFFPPYFVEMGHTIPSCADEKTKNSVILAFAQGVKALGLTNGAAKGDIKITKHGAIIGEIAARLSGGYMSAKTFPLASDFPLTKIALQIALGKTPNELLENRLPLKNFKSENLPFKIFEIPCKRFCAERAWISIPGKIESAFVTCAKNSKKNNFYFNSDFFLNEDELFLKRHSKKINEDSENSKKIEFLPKIFCGDEVVFPKNNVEKCGNVIATANSYREATQKAEFAVKNIVLSLAKNEKTDLFFSQQNFQQKKSYPKNAFSDFKTKSRQKDWNHKTIFETLKILKKLVPNFKIPSDLEQDFKKFVLRAGIQGALYFLKSKHLIAEN